MIYLVRSIPAQCVYLDPRYSGVFFEYLYTDRHGKYDEPVMMFGVPNESSDVHVTEAFLGKDLQKHSSTLHDMIEKEFEFEVRPMGSYHLVCVRDE